MGSEFWTKFEDDCKHEIKKMGQKMYLRRNVTFTDLLKKELRHVALLLKEEVGVVEIEKEFPIYAKMLRERIQKAKQMSRVMTAGFEGLKLLLSRVPNNILVGVMSYLENDDIEMLSKIWSEDNMKF